MNQGRDMRRRSEIAVAGIAFLLLGLAVSGWVHGFGRHLGTRPDTPVVAELLFYLSGPLWAGLLGILGWRWVTSQPETRWGNAVVGGFVGLLIPPAALVLMWLTLIPIINTSGVARKLEAAATLGTISVMTFGVLPAPLGAVLGALVGFLTRANRRTMHGDTGWAG